jgi:hypothetical protein
MSEITSGAPAGSQNCWRPAPRLTGFFASAMVSALLVASSAHAFQWTRYTEHRSGMSITYPLELFPKSAATDDGVQFSGQNAELELSSRRDVGVDSTDELRDLMMAAEGYSSLTYSPGGHSWMVASGYRGADIYYEKFFVLNGEVRAFSIQYPKSLRSIYDPVVEGLEDTFQPW